MTQTSDDPNAQLIEAFRANNGEVGGPFEGKRLILLHHVGRRTGREYVAPLVSATDGDAYLICGSKGGAPTDPLWVANIEAGSGETTIEIDDRHLRVKTTVVRPSSPGWQRLYEIWSQYWPDAEQYEHNTSRQFPMVRLVPVA